MIHIETTSESDGEKGNERGKREEECVGAGAGADGRSGRIGIIYGVSYDTLLKDSSSFGDGRMSLTLGGGEERRGKKKEKDDGFRISKGWTSRISAWEVADVVFG